MLDAVVIGCLVGAGLCFVFAFIALYIDREQRTDIKATAEKLNATAVAAADAMNSPPDPSKPLTVQPQAAFAGPAEYLKALAQLSDSLSKLRQAVAALVLALAFILVAAIGAGIEDKI